jgi:putative ABC transport system permease protein
MSRFSMFARMLFRATTVRRGRALVVVLALVVAAAAGTALLNLYADVDAKLNREFRNFGANLVVTSRTDQPLPVNGIVSLLHAEDFAVPYAYAIAKLPDGRPIVVAGTFISKARTMNPGWKVTGTFDHEAPLVGKRVSALVDPGTITLTFAGQQHTLSQFNALAAGSAEDDRIYVPLHAFLAWTGLHVNTLEISIAGNATAIADAEHRIATAFPDLQVRPVRQLVEAETTVLGKSRSVFLLVSALVAVLVALCVLATLTSSVLERRRDFALMKALGCSQGTLTGLFLIEAMLIAIIGAGVGFGVGLGIAYVIGQVNFHTAVVPRFGVFPAVLAGCVLIALIGALVPLARLRSIQPAVILKGD